jgi:hypothetical protein
MVKIRGMTKLPVQTGILKAILFDQTSAIPSSKSKSIAFL